MEKSNTQVSYQIEVSSPEDGVSAMTGNQTQRAVENLTIQLEPLSIQDFDRDGLQAKFVEGSTTQLPKPNEFVIPKDQAYAMTEMETWEAVQHIMVTLEPFNLEDLDPDDGCRHIDWAAFIIRLASIDLCEPIEQLAARLWFWDNVYTFVGIARSEKEEHTREYLWKFVNLYRSIKPVELDPDTEFQFLMFAQDRLWDFAGWLKHQALTPTQEDLRKKLRRLGEYDLTDLIPLVYDESCPFVFNPVPYVARLASISCEDEYY